MSTAVHCSTTVLGIWNVFVYCLQIEETISQVPNVPEMEGDGPSSKKKQALPKQSLLAWAESVLAKWAHQAFSLFCFAFSW